jgi:uncharacterized protein YggU (UPF0235/DUF167 family)
VRHAGPGELRLAVRLTPRGGVDRVERVQDGVLHCRVAAAPADGAANAALVRLIGRELDLPASAVRLVGGATARRKVLAVDVAQRARVAARWPGLID